MSAASEGAGDFDLSGFKSKPRKKAADDASAPSPSRASSGPSKDGPKRTGKLPPGFKSRERNDKTDRPFRKPAGDGPRKPFAGDFRPREGERGDRPAWKKKDGPGRPSFDGPRKPYGERSERPFDGPRKSFDGPRKPFDGPRKPYGDRGEKPAFRKPFDRGDRPARPYADRGQGGDRPAWKKPAGPRGGAPAFAEPKPFVSELSPEVKKFLPLMTEKGRHKESRFLIEGAKNVADVAEHSPDIIHTVLVAEGFQDAALKERLNALRVRTRVVAESDLSALCGTETPQGIVAVANFGSLRPDWNTIQTVTLLDGVQDPGNLGAILRTSAALGMEAVVLGKGTCDPYNPKVVRASAAALLRMPLETGEDLASKIHFLRLKGFSIVATSPHAKITLEHAKLRRKVALLFGNEGGGVGANLIDQADEVVRIPMKGKVESLNVAVAHGLLSYDLMRMKR